MGWLLNYEMEYFILPSCYIAFNYKAGSSTLACATIKFFYPEIEEKTRAEHNALYAKFPVEFWDKLPPSFSEDPFNSFGIWQRLCPKTTTPDKVVFLPVRDPVERFRSATAQSKINVDQILDSLPNDDVHFSFQSDLVVPNMTKLYKFPEQLDVLAVDAGLPLPLPNLNKNKEQKPILSEKQINKIKSYYSEDVKLFEAVSI